MTPQLMSSEFTAVQPEGFIQLAGRWFANLPTATRDETGWFIHWGSLEGCGVRSKCT